MALSDAVVASLLVKIGADIRDLKRGMGQADKAVQGFGAGTAAAMSSVGASVQSAGASMVSTGAQFDSVIGRGARSVLTTMISKASEFEAATKVMDAATLNVGEAMQSNLHEAAKLFAADVDIAGVSSMEAVEGMTNLLKAGQSVTDMFGGAGGLNQYLKEGTNLQGTLKASADLAAAGQLGFGSSTDALAVAMATFKLGTEDAIGISDSFVQSADASVSSVSELIMSMKDAGPQAAALDMSLDDLNTVMALFSERGVTGAKAGNLFRSMTGNMLRPTEKVTGALDKMGVAMWDTNGALRDFPDIFGDMQGALKGFTAQEADALMESIFGRYGKTGGLIMAEEGAEGWDIMKAKIAEAATAAQVAEKMTEGMGGAMGQLNDAIELFMINAGEPLIRDVLTPLALILTDVIGGLAKSSPAFFKIAGMVLIAAAAFGPLLMGLGSLVSIVGMVISAGGAIVGAVGGIGAAIASVAAPVILIGGLIAGLVWAIKNNFLGIGDWFEVAFEKIKKVWGAFTAFLQPGIDWLKKTIGGIFSGIFAKAPGKKGGFMGITPGTELKDTATGMAAMGAAAAVADPLVGRLASTLTDSELASVLGRIAEDGYVVSESFYAIGEAAPKVTEAGDAASTAFDGVGEDWRTTWLDMREIVGTGATEIGALVGGLKEGVVTDFAEMNQAVVGGSIVPDMVMGILSWFGTLVAQGVALFTGLKTTILGILGSLANEAYEKGKALATRFGEGVKNALNKALSAARAIAAAIRALLPGSDAKEGPLSDIFASGKALPTTLAKGMMAGMSPLNRQVGNMAAGMAPGGSRPGTQMPGRTTTNNITIMNPSAQASERSIMQTMRLLSVTGVL